VRLWEEEIFPARDKQYRGENLENALREGRLIWYGAGKERAAFCSPEEWELAEQAVPGNPLAAVCGNYKSFWEIKDELVRRGSYGNPGAELSAGFVAEKLWEAVWAGKLSSDSWEALRRESYDRKSYDRESPGSPAKRGIPAGKGIRGIIPSYQASGGKLPRALRERRQEGPVPGRWYSLETEPPEERPPEEQLPGESRPPAEVFFIEEDERGRERVRLLLRRWGILCRPLVETESCFSWAALLPAMRRMELAGELSAGRFFEGIPSLQFASPAIAEELEAAEALAASGPLYWMNAADPASPAGRNMENQDRRLPARNAHSRLCFRGSSLIALSLKSGRELEIFIPPDDKDIPGILEFVKAPRTRLCRPVKKLALEKINGKDAAASSYREAFLAAGFIADRGRLFLW
jgi:ATP-dependent Lhr-like helicase